MVSIAAFAPCARPSAPLAAVEGVAVQMHPDTGWAVHGRPEPRAIPHPPLREIPKPMHGGPAAPTSHPTEKIPERKENPGKKMEHRA